MSNAITILPDAQLEVLQRSYRSAMAARWRRGFLFGISFVLCVAVASIVAEVDLPRLIRDIGKFTSYFGRLTLLENNAPVWTDFEEWFWGLKKWSLKIGETLMIAYLGTVLGATAAFFCCFPAASNLVRSKAVLFVSRRLLEFCRTVPELVFALMFVVAFGLGPVPGVLAIAIHTFGALGKQFAEVVENIDMKPFEGVTAVGSTWTQAVRYSVVPQVLSNFASYGLLRFEVNVRGAAIMGFVGAGGIGHELLIVIRRFNYSDVSAILLMIIATVMLIDMVTERIRMALLGQERRV
ncbi:MAG: phosphonate ABC transporter, permease protein PhnE [Proteobacteria bacterium]|nr:phosphonate ABC transporter, permease protein PhnE [Pseudomonadota bacterium]